MKLRWLVVTQVVTPDDVLAERDRTDDSLMVCKQRLLKNANSKVLQCLVSDSLGQETWVDVPIVIEES